MEVKVECSMEVDGGIFGFGNFGQYEINENSVNFGISLFINLSYVYPVTLLLQGKIGTQRKGVSASRIGQ